MHAESASATALEWSDVFLLGYGKMDSHHQEFVRTLNELAAATPEQLPAMLEQFITATEAHFNQENTLMEQTEFPPRDCHIGEHAKVMETLHEARDRIASGGSADFMPGLIEALTDWFPGHTDYLDASLAQWLTKKEQGGVPVVLKKKLVFD